MNSGIGGGVARSVAAIAPHGPRHQVVMAKRKGGAVDASTIRPDEGDGGPESSPVGRNAVIRPVVHNPRHKPAFALFGSEPQW